jgi:hypothetical protein
MPSTGTAIKQSKKVGLITNSTKEVTQETALGAVGSMVNKTSSVETDKIDEEEQR